MKLALDLTTEAQNRLHELAKERGLSIEQYIQALLQEKGTARLRPDIERSKMAGDRIVELRKGVTLGGISIRELIKEGCG